MEPFDLDLDSFNFTETPIFRAIKRQNHHKLLQALHTGENVHLRDHEFHSTYLHVLCSLADSTTEPKFLPMVYQLSNAGIDVNARDYKGRTALELALGRELQDIMCALLRCGTDPTERDYKKMIADNGSPFEYELVNTIEKFEPGLWVSVSNNDTGMVHMLTNSWCRVNACREGVTLLQMARATGKSEELINVLDDYEVTIEFVHATLAGDEKRMLEFLMDAKPCDPNIMDISYQERWSLPLEPRSLRDTAFHMGHTHILHLLPEDEADTIIQPTAQTDVPRECDEQQQQNQRPMRHIRDKGRTVTVMAITSLNGYVPGSDTMSPLGNIGEDDDSDDGDGDYDDIREVPDEYQYHHQNPPQMLATVGRQNSYRLSDKPHNPSVHRLPQQSRQDVQQSNHTSHQTNSNSAQNNSSTFGGSPMSAPTSGTDPGALASNPYHQGRREPREYYFHEVDGFVDYYEGSAKGESPAFKTYVCRPNGAEDRTDKWKQMRRTDKKSTRSKMCVIS